MMDGYAMTRDDVYALRHADRLGFGHDKVEGADWIKAIRERPVNTNIREVSAFHRKGILDERERIIWLNDATNFGFAATFSLSANRDLVWGTIARAIKKGSVLSLHWFPDLLGCDYTRSAGLFYDQVNLRVLHNGTLSEFLLGTRVTPDNTARMVKLVNEEGLIS